MKESHSNTQWNLQSAVIFSTLLECVAPLHGFHVALTGGCLYKEGSRKDCDVILYRIRKNGIPSNNDIEELFHAFKEIGVEIISEHVFVVKANYNGANVDFLIPESRFGVYYNG